VHFSDKAPETVEAESIGDELRINSFQGAEVTRSQFLSQRDADGREKSRINRPSVVIYSAVWCGVCKRERQYFNTNKIPFNEYDVETSEKDRKDFLSMKGRGVPIIFIGKKRMNGFNSASFKKVYDA